MLGDYCFFHADYNNITGKSMHDKMPVTLLQASSAEIQIKTNAAPAFLLRAI
jgi:hypothetical protein